MKLRQSTFAILLLFLVDTINGKGGMGGGGRGGFGGGFRGASGARSSVFSGSKGGGFFSSSKTYGGSFKSSGSNRANYRTRNIGGSSYYIPTSSIRSRDAFRGSFRSGFMGGMAGYFIGRTMMIHSAMTPMRINNYEYYFNRENYHGRGDQFCAASIQQVDSNQVPFDTSAINTSGANEKLEMSQIDNEPVNTTSEALDVENSTQSADDFKFSDITFEDGQHPTELVWNCPNQQDRCCYMECCPLAEDGGTEFVGYILLIFLMVVILLIVCNNRR